MARRTGSGRGRRARSSPLTLGDSVTQSIRMRFSVHTGLDERRGVVGSAISLRRSLPEEISIHDPALLLFGFASDLLNVVHELSQIARHEDLVFSSDVGTPVDIDLRIIDVL